MSITNTDDTIEAVSSSVEIASSSLVSTDDIPKEHEVQFEDNNFILSSASTAGLAAGTDIPDWLNTAITDRMLEGTSSFRDVIADLGNVIRQLETGVNSQITSVQTELVNQHTQLDSNVSRLDDDLAAQLSIINTKVTDTEARASSLDVLNSNFNTVASRADSYVVQVAQTLNTADESQASLIDGLTSTYNTLNGDYSLTADAVTTLNTKVGITGGVYDGTGLAQDVTILQKQNDGVIETRTGTYDVITGDNDPNGTAELVIGAEPYSTWAASESSVEGEEEYIRAAHIGDVYIKYTTDGNGVKSYVAAYKFIKTVVDESSPYSTDAEGYTWAIITDTDTQNAYMIALQAHDLADGKRRVFVGLGDTTTPSTPYDPGDLWLIDADRTILGVDYKVGDILRSIDTKPIGGTYESNDWVLASSYANAVQEEALALEEWKTDTYGAFVTDISTQVDNKAEVFYKSAPPRAEGTNPDYAKWIGDIWKNPSDNVEKVYSEISAGHYGWVTMDVPDSLFDMVDGKSEIFVGPKPINKDILGADGVTVVGTSPSVNDMWIPGAGINGYIEGKIYTYTAQGTNPETYEWEDKTSLVNDQTLKDITDGTTKIDLSQYVHDIGWETLNEINTTGGVVLNDWVTGTYDAGVITTQEKLDAKVESYYTDDGTKPYNDNVGELKNDGDLWYSRSTKLLHRYKYVSDADREWVLVEDQKAIDAATAASTAQSTADGKIVTWLDDNAPNPTGSNIQQNGEGDIWLDTNDHNKMYRYDGTYPYNSGGWKSVRDTKNDQALSTATTNITGLQETDDGVVNSFYNVSKPTSGMSYGDWWIDISDGNNPVANRYEDPNGKNVGVVDWRVNTTHPLGQAYLAAVGAQKTADGKIKSYFQSSVPTADGAGDIWVDIGHNNTTYRAKIKGANEKKPGEWERITDDSTLDHFISATYSKDLVNIGKQADGVAVTYFQTSEPYSAAAGTSENTGDTWLNVNTASATLSDDISSAVLKRFKYTYTVNNVTYPSEWVTITESKIVNAIKDAAITKAASDRSIQSFTGDTTPAHPFFVGDTWMEGASGDIWVCKANSTKDDSAAFRKSKWMLASKYIDQSAITTLTTDIGNGNITINLDNVIIPGSSYTSISDYVSTEIDKEVVVYSGTNHNNQTGMKINDIYIEKTVDSSGAVPVDVVNSYIYTSSGWAIQGSNSNLVALADMSDGKRTIYSGSGLPTENIANPFKDNDLFIPTTTFSNGGKTYEKDDMYRYVKASTEWVKATRYDGIISDLSTQILDEKVETTYSDTYPFPNKTNVEKDPKGGDYWFCSNDHTAASVAYTKGTIYKYEESSNGGNFDYTWVVSSDVSKDAFDLANIKRTIFGNAGNDVPTAADGLKDNDLWIPASTSGSYVVNKVYKYNSGSTPAWEQVDYTNDKAINDITGGTTPLDSSVIKIDNAGTSLTSYVKEQSDYNTHVYSGIIRPEDAILPGLVEDDIYIWFATKSSAKGVDYDNTKQYKYSNAGNWVQINASAELAKLADLSDNKRTLYAGTTTPEEQGYTPEKNDMWFPEIGVKGYTVGKGYQYTANNTWRLATLEYITILQDGFEDGIDKWSIRGNSTIQLDDNAYEGSNSALIRSSDSSADSSGTVDGVHISTAGSVIGTAGKTVLVKVRAKKPSSNASTQFAMSYSTNAVGNSGWQYYKATTNWNEYIFSYNVASTNTTDDYLGIWGDTEGSGRGVLIDSVVISVGSEESVSDAVNATANSIITLQNQVDGTITGYTGASDPKIAWDTTTLKEQHHGDVWYKDDGTSFRYDSATNSWNSAPDLDQIGLDAAAYADGKASIYFGTSSQRTAKSNGWTNTEKSNNIGDVWYQDPDVNGVSGKTTGYRWSGNAWYELQDGVAFANAEAITGLHTDLGTGFNASSTVAQTINAVDDKIETNFRYDTKTEINGRLFNAGFGLVTNASNGTFDPNIGTAGNTYNSEFWVKANKFRISDGSNAAGWSDSFSIEAGSPNKIKFNGVVDFSNSSLTKQNYLPLQYTSFRSGYTPPITAHNVGSYNVTTNSNTGFCRFGMTANASDSYIYFGKSSADYNINIIPNRKWMISFYGASATSGNTQVFLRSSNGDHTAGTVYLPAGYTRVHTIIDLSNNNSTKAILRIDNDNGDSNYMWIGNIMMELLDAGQTEPSPFMTPSTDFLSAYSSGTTTIDGNQITTGTLFSNFIGTEVIYDSSHWSNGVEQSSNTYKMKIDLNAGSIHIK